MSGSSTATSKNKTKKRKNKYMSLFLYFLVFLIIFTISTLASYTYFVNEKEINYEEVLSKIDPENGIQVEIPRGANTEDIANILKKEGVIKYPFWFKFVSKFNGYDGRYKSGKHIVDKDLEYKEIMEILCSNPVTTTVTIIEGKNTDQIADILSEKKVVDKDAFVEACNTEKFDYEFLKDIPESPERKNRLEGYLFPDTYFFDPKSGERAIIEKFLDNFDAKFKPEFYERAKELNMTVDEVIILASIIERETALPEERPIVSSVFHNRLKSSNAELKKLQSCATVQYILYETQGKMKEKLSDEDTQINHPYNTYLHEGLPPGPICCPGLASIEAALYPDEESEYLYFVAKGDGSHHFSKTLAEHLEAVKKYEAN
ncbi:MAG TPA: endolytic transglycosylase MltG [Acetivibrio sp.]|uniref:endolytic transglycosylase MltG n=1 Tax=Acetivibrio sp. TaxID=1872092 RepID=UPI002C9F240F|nr:endolytic transglycosylase MltG [Acetivibrio sp.]HOM01236.1 endolytic transglycosylase MltG [Acetivibrio sp.]